MARLRLSRSGPWIGVVGMVCLLWLDVASLLLAPWWGVVLMLAGWLLSLVLLLGWIRPQPKRSAFAPVAGLVVWGVVVWPASAGGTGAAELARRVGDTCQPNLVTVR